MTDAHHDPGADLDARLAALADSPLSLTGAHAARLRGRERTRRARAVLGGSGALAALLAVTTAAVLTGGSTPAREDGTLSIPTSAPTRAESPVAAALLDADDLRLLGGDASWTRRPTDDAPFSVLPEDCGDGRAFTTAVPRNGDTGTGLRYLDGDLDGAPVVLGHQVLSFGDEDTAATALGRLVDAVDTCADDGASTGLTPDAPTASATRLFGRQPAGDAVGVFVVFVVEPLGAVLSVVRLQPSPAPRLDPALADAAAAEVRAAGLVRDPAPSAPTTTRATAAAPLDPACPDGDVVCRGTPEPLTPARTASPGTPPRTTPRDLTTAVLTVQDAQRAEPGSWRRDGFADEGPVLDPCPGGTRYPRDAERLGDASTVLVSTREAGGTTVVQQVAQYPSRVVAADAAAGYDRAVEGCPTSPRDAPEGGTTTYEVLGGEEVGGAPTTYVRRTSTPGQDVVVPFAQRGAARLVR